MALLVALVIAGAVPVAAGASTPHDLRGTWDCCGSGGAGAQKFVIDAMDQASGNFTGRATYANGTAFSDIAGTANGNSVSLTTGPYYGSSYSATFTGTIAADSQSMSGTWQSNASQSGTWTATRSTAGGGGGGGGGANKKPTVTQVTTCNRGPQPESDAVCTASVADTGADPKSPPSGTVRFTARQGGFRAGDTCTLSTSPSTPTSSSCSVTWVPPAGGWPAGLPMPVTATYLGSSVHAQSTGTTQSKIAVAGVVPYPPTASQCRAAANAAPRAAAPLAIKALNMWNYPNENSTVLDKVSYGAQTCFHAATGLTGQVIRDGSRLAVPITVAGTYYLNPTPVGVGVYVGNAIVGAIVTFVGIPAGQSIMDTSAKAQQDPPDPNFRHIATPRKVPRIHLRLGAGLSRAEANRLEAMLNQQLLAASLGHALGTSIDRAGGALKAKNRLWQGRQMRAAIGYARRLASVLTSLATLTTRAAGAAKGVPSLATPAAQSLLASRHADVARRGLPSATTRLLRRLGFTASELAATRRAVAGSTVDAQPQSIAAHLADPALGENYRMVAAAWLLWVHAPEVTAPARLR
ncbi:MAG: hypothetical protein QOE65_876 [Solirubrobacteraceae bacterium]|jgi:hypothetical protein|nr:hypothetical protein [Solirubrobacteraceae bacterium]